MSGHVVKDRDVRCPKCGAEIEYNGNYYCSRWGDCDWAMGEQNSPFNRKVVRAYLTQRLEDVLAQPEVDQEEYARIVGYLEDAGE